MVGQHADVGIGKRKMREFDMRLFAKKVVVYHIIFCRVCLSRTSMLRFYYHHAVLEAISECVKRNVLKEYLSDHESEVLDIMTTLFDQESLTKQMMNRQYRMGDARRLVNDVENIMSHYGVSLAEACDVTRCSVEEYYRAKNLLNSEM